MESAQLVFTYIFDFFFYSFTILFIFEFLLGWSMAGLTAELNESEALSPQQLKPPPSLESAAGQLSEIEPVVSESHSRFDDATLQYLEMVGANVDDFESIAQARQFLDEFAPWTVEEEPTQLKSQANKLTFEQVQTDFTDKGFMFQCSRSGHNRYRVISFGNPPNSHRFKTLREALDWLVISEPLRV